jgi:hypothetical protein
MSRKRKAFWEALPAAFENREEFSLFPDVVPLPLPASHEWFTIPDEWKSFEPYREIERNKYFSSSQRSSIFCFEEAPPCSCKDDCGDSCQNRMLFMYVTRQLTLLSFCAYFISFYVLLL